MAHINNAGYAIVDTDPNTITELQSGHIIKLAVLTDGTKIWRFVVGNTSGSKWVEVNLETFTESGTRAGGDAITIVGDYDDSSNGTKIKLDDATEKITLLSKKISIGTTDTHTLNSTVFQKIIENPLLGGAMANEVKILERTHNPTGTGYYHGEHKTITRSGTDNETGTKGVQLIVEKTGDFDSLVLYGRDLEVNLDGEGTTTFLIGEAMDVRARGTKVQTINGVARGTSTTLLADNPNVTGYFQTSHPVLDLKQGHITGGETIFMDFDIDHSNPNLDVQGDLTYLAGGGGSDVAAMKTKLEAINKKFRFIYNQGETESDFGGILNYTGSVSNIENASNKVLINKEYLESLNYIDGTGTANYLSKFTDSDTEADSQIFDNGTNVGIGTATPSASAKLQLDSTSQGFLPPRMTEVQRDAIISPEEGLMIYQTDATKGWYGYNGTAWIQL